MALTLTKQQARAIHSAVVALESINATTERIFLPDGVSFVEFAYGGGKGVSSGGRTVEQYESMDDFAIAYGIATPGVTLAHNIHR